MEKPRRTRRTFSETQKATFVAQWRESKQSAHAFGKARGIGAGNLIRWKDQQERGKPEQSGKMTFFPLQVLQERVDKAATRVTAKIMVGKLCVQLMGGAQTDDVQRLLAALQAVQP